MRADVQESEPSMKGWVWLLAIFVFAILARSLDVVRVFVGDDEVVFAAGDAYYHARRAFYSFLEFPGWLRFDSCINHPDGAHVPHPPLLDWATAALARGLGDSRAVFERTAAWVPVGFASASVFPIYALGRYVASPLVGRLAAFLYAALPISVNYGQLGNFDHHAPAGFFGACLVWLYVRILGGARVGLGKWVALIILRLALMLTWNGSLLYLLPGDAALLFAAVHKGGVRNLRELALAAFATCVVAWPLAVFLGRSDGDAAFLVVEFSRLHGLVYGALAVLCCVLAISFARWPAMTSRQHWIGLVLVALPITFACFSIPGVSEGLGAGLGFLGAADGYTETVVEQLPLFWGHGRYSLWVGTVRMGLFAFAIPLVPIAMVAMSRRACSPPVALYLAGWTLMIGFLAVGQVRYFHDFAPAGCVGLAWLVIRCADLEVLRRFWPASRNSLAFFISIVLLAPAVVGFYFPTASLLWHALQGELGHVDRALLSVPGSQVRFAQLVDEVTGEEGRCAAGYGEAPAYGVLAHVGLGHVLHYSAGRATPADPFGPYIGEKNFRAVEAFWNATGEARALDILDRLGTPWVATAADAIPRSVLSIAHRLHEQDGSFVDGAAALGQLRLVTEGPTGGLAMATLFGDEREQFAPYKLFERVAGAQLELRGPPGQQLTAELPLKTPSGRRFVYRAVARANASGIARLRVPYANPRDRPRVRLDQPVERVTALGPYAMRAGARRFRVHVSEAQVREGETVPVAAFETLD